MAPLDHVLRYMVHTRSMALRTGEVAKAAGVNIQTLRFYEREGLIAPPKRTASGYRQYSEDTVRIVTFIKRAQELGFTLREAKELLKLRAAGPARGPAARVAAEIKLRDIDEKIRDLTAIRAALSSLVETCACAGGSVYCPILESLEKPSAGG
ncbi:MerR family transcriptional regulator [Sorangium sp. So ce861]|uniref:MerR family transcriptional regulator n=1 Tax=Sorangium sp. So ce861 TaxID=3133323 RepID=UPI003F6452B1